jgi:hypothetical protein
LKNELKFCAIDSCQFQLGVIEESANQARFLPQAPERKIEFAMQLQQIPLRHVRSCPVPLIREQSR